MHHDSPEDHREDDVVLPPAETPPRKGFARVLEFLSDILLNAVTIVCLVVVIRFVLISPFEIKGESMEPNFHSDELIIVDKISYRFQAPARGDVIVLRPPEANKTKQYYVKRIIGLPGEKLQLKNGHVVIYNAAHPEGTTLEESYIADDVATDGLSSEPVAIPEDAYFVLGDNRGSSSDSRSWGALPKWNIVGRAWLVVWPPTQTEVVRGPSYPS